MDLSSSFWSQELEPGSQDYTAFGVPGHGHYCYSRSAQGLVNSSASFQRLLDHVVQGLRQVYVYIDDVILAHDTHEQHLLASEMSFCVSGNTD